jgi:hypothetical protein
MPSVFFNRAARPQGDRKPGKNLMRVGQHFFGNLVGEGDIAALERRA